MENCTTDDCNAQPDHLEAIWKPGLETNSGALKSSEGLGLSEGFVEESKDLSETGKYLTNYDVLPTLLTFLLSLYKNITRKRVAE